MSIVKDLLMRSSCITRWADLSVFILFTMSGCWLDDEPPPGQVTDPSVYESGESVPESMMDIGSNALDYSHHDRALDMSLSG